jgi:hypothetical protein
MPKKRHTTSLGISSLFFSFLRCLSLSSSKRAVVVENRCVALKDVISTAIEKRKRK